MKPSPVLSDQERTVVLVAPYAPEMPMLNLGASKKIQLIASLLTEDSRSWQVALPGSVYFLLSFTGLLHVAGQRWGARRWPARAED